MKKEDDPHIICLDNNIHEILLSKKIVHKNIWEYPLNGSIEKEILSWFKKWANKPSLEGNNIKGILDYKGISLWWFLEIGIFDSYRGLNNPVPVKKLLEKLELLDSIVKIENPQKVIFLNTANPHNFYYAEIFSILGYKINHIKNTKVYLKALFWSHLFPILIRQFITFRRITRQIVSILLLRNNNDKFYFSNKKFVIISLTSNWKKKKDFIFESLIHSLSKKNQIVRVDFPVFSMIGLKNIFEMKGLLYPNISFKTAEKYNVDFGMVADSTKQIQEIYKKMKKNDVYYKSHDITKLFYEQLDFHMYSYGLQNSIYFLEVILKIIEQENPTSLILIDEYNPIGRATVTAGKLANIKTIALQHGAISTSRPSYVHFEYEVSKIGEYHTPYYPLPDITAVFGPYYMDLLQDIGNYPSDSLMVTGSIRYDIVPEKKKQFNREATLLKLGLDPSKNMILYTSQPIDKEEKEKIFAALEKAISELPDCQLVIKLHPAEMQPVKNIFLESGEKVHVVKNIDIYEIINSCDVMLTAFSTTAMEAMILEKPVITINLTGKPDMMPYAKRDAAMGVYTEKDLPVAIISILEDEQLRAKFVQNSETFVYQHLFEMDGNATQRVVQIIENN